MPDDIAGRNGVAHRDADILNFSSFGRRNIHRRLVGLQSNESVFPFDRIARGDQYLDHFDVVEITEIGNNDVEGFRHLERHRIPAIRIDAVLLNGLTDRLLVQNAVVGQRF